MDAAKGVGRGLRWGWYEVGRELRLRLGAARGTERVETRRGTGAYLLSLSFVSVVGSTRVESHGKRSIYLAFGGSKCPRERNGMGRQGHAETRGQTWHIDQTRPFLGELVERIRQLWFPKSPPRWSFMSSKTLRLGRLCRPGRSSSCRQHRSSARTVLALGADWRSFEQPRKGGDVGTRHEGAGTQLLAVEWITQIDVLDIHLNGSIHVRNSRARSTRR